jgi:molybdopterin synthase catalytic subunit
VSVPEGRSPAWPQQRRTEGQPHPEGTPELPEHAVEPSGQAVKVAAVRDCELSLDEVRAAVAGDAVGGIALFAGTVRDNDHAQDVTGLSYTAHPSAEAELRRVAEAVAEKFAVLAVAVVHRVGDLAVGDVAVVAAVSAAHRAEAFDACRELIDELKATVPIWKHQRFTDGTDEWVGTP